MTLTPTESNEDDSDSMKDFIVEEDDDDSTEHVKSENQPQQKELLNTSNSEFLAHYVPHCKIKISVNSICIT